MIKIKLSREEWEDLYLKQKLSTRQIAKKLGVTKNAITYWL